MLYNIKIYPHIFFFVIFQINRIDDHDDSVFWVQYFKEISNNKWSLEQKQFSAIHTDFSRILAPPDLVFESCSRFYYKFQDL